MTKDNSDETSAGTNVTKPFQIQRKVGEMKTCVTSWWWCQNIV